jgi:hypothetical protein
MRKLASTVVILGCLFNVFFIGYEQAEAKQPVALELTDEQIKNIVRRSYQYVALYNVINKFATDPNNPAMIGWNNCVANTELKDHNLKLIARPNNDTLYIDCAFDLRKDAMVLEVPVFSSKYVSLMTFTYDHYVNVPLTTRNGDFQKPEKVLFYSARTEGYNGEPEKVLFYSARTEGYNGEPVEGISRIFEATGDFYGALFRVMPHTNEPEKFNTILNQMKSVKFETLSAFRGGKAKSIDDATFPPFGKTDADVFGNNLLEVMQFVFNHLTFDPNDEIDKGILAAYKPLGIEPGKAYNPSEAVQIDGEKFRKIAQQIQKEKFARLATGDISDLPARIFRPKGETDLEALVSVSVIGPIGLPLEEATYPAVITADGKPMNAMNDYVIRMSKDELPPARAFWSLTLYDLKNGFFIPNDLKKYSVGENAGMKLNANGGIEIHVAAEQPESVPEENWLPINRKDENIDIILRIYVPDLEKLKSWNPPLAEMVN